MRNSSETIIRGKLIDKFTRCVHYHSSLDIIAIKFKCCGDYYPCYRCHEESTTHEAKVWKKQEFDEKAVLCGSCQHEMTISEYIQADNRCPQCSAPFNPNCLNHYSLYFDV